MSLSSITIASQSLLGNLSLLLEIKGYQIWFLKLVKLGNPLKGLLPVGESLWCCISYLLQLYLYICWRHRIYTVFFLKGENLSRSTELTIECFRNLQTIFSQSSQKPTKSKSIHRLMTLLGWFFDLALKWRNWGISLFKKPLWSFNFKIWAAICGSRNFITKFFNRNLYLAIRLPMKPFWNKLPKSFKWKRLKETETVILIVEALFESMLENRDFNWKWKFHEDSAVNFFHMYSNVCAKNQKFSLKLKIFRLPLKKISKIKIFVITRIFCPSLWKKNDTNLHLPKRK